jgi:poly-gamma-glutamate synthesis protein (capsule biosynthesis protein)
VEFVTLGNNHVLDFGEQGYADTKSALDSAGVAYAGRDEHTIYTTESGLKIGVYAASFGTVEQIKEGIAALKNGGAEFIIAALHWGDEGSYDINADQTEQGHAAVDAGANIVYGSHPHTLQPIEKYNGAYIFYSMGNWSFGGNTDPRDKDTFIAQLTVQRDVNGAISITGLNIIPCASSGTEEGNNYQPVPYDEGSEQYDRVLSKLDGSFTGANLTIGYEYGFDEFASTQQ